MFVPNIKSAIKRVKTSEERGLRNASFRTEARTAVKKVEAAIFNNDVDAAKENIVVATKKLDKAAGKGVIHKNAVARQKSRLMKKLNKMDA